MNKNGDRSTDSANYCKLKTHEMPCRLCEAASCLYTVSSELVTAKSTHFFPGGKIDASPEPSIILGRKDGKSSFEIL